MKRDTPSCPHCGGPLHRERVLRDGTQQYRCRECRARHPHGMPGAPRGGAGEWAEKRRLAAARAVKGCSEPEWRQSLDRFMGLLQPRALATRNPNLHAALVALAAYDREKTPVFPKPSLDDEWPIS